MTKSEVRNVVLATIHLLERRYGINCDNIGIKKAETIINAIHSSLKPSNK